MTSFEPAQTPKTSIEGGRATEEPGTTKALMALAQRLQAALTPVEPRPGFLSQLGRQLAADRPKMLAEARAREKDQRLMWVAGVGGAISLLGLGFVGYRAAQARGLKFGRATAAKAVRV